MPFRLLQYLPLPLCSKTIFDSQYRQVTLPCLSDCLIDLAELSAIFQFVVGIYFPEDAFPRRTEDQNPRTSNTMSLSTLPSEILGRIFLLGMQHPEASATPQKFLLTISHVSSRWRQLVLSLHHLWASLFISFPIDARELDRAQVWLQRSRPYPVRLTIDLCDPDWDFNEETHSVRWFEAQAIMGVILPEAERWQEIKMLADNWEPLYAFLYFTQKIALPLLHSVGLRRCNPYFAGPDRTFAPSKLRAFVPFFGGQILENLRTIVLEGVHVDWENLAALRGLTRLSLGYLARDVLPTLDEFRDLLSSSPQLESLVVMGWGPRLSKDPDVKKTKLQQFRATIQLPRLKTFELGVMVPSYAVDLLSLLALPALEALTLDDITRYDAQTLVRPKFDVIFDCLSGQTSRSSHSTSISTHLLTSLTILNLDISYTSFRRFLQGLHQLRVLTVDNCSASALEALSPNNTGVPCQSLQHLSTEACDPCLLIEIIRARRMQHDINAMDVVFRHDQGSPISTEIARQFAQFDIESLPSHDRDLSWRKFMMDDSDDLVAAILDERWDVAGAPI